MTNRSEWASGGDEDRIIESALRGRAYAIRADIAHAQEEGLKKMAAA
jgi:hypothetical protein